MTLQLRWKLFADLAEHAGSRDVPVVVDPGATVGDALETLLSDRPALRDRVLEGGELSPEINVLRNGTNVQTQADDLETPVTDGDELALFPPVSGG